MTVVLGDRRRFAVEVGAWAGPALRRVDLWAATHRRLVAGTGQEGRDDLLRRRFRIFDRWGPTTDNLTAFAFRAGDHLEFTWQFWREAHLRIHPEHVGVVFTLEIRATEVTAALDDLVAILDRDDGRQRSGD